MTDDEQWEFDRLQEYARGRRRHWGDEQSLRVRSRSSVLRRFQEERALLDVMCRGRLIARVYAGDDDRHHIAAEMVGGEGTSGHSLTTVPIGLGLVVGCRGKHTHDLDAAALNTEAMQARPGRPRRAPVTKVEKPASAS